MKHTLLPFLLFCLSQLAYAQKTNKPDPGHLISVWGEVPDTSSEHRGKEGLVLLRLNQDSTFSAYENTDYGAYILQQGNWSCEKSRITFIVTKTILARKEKEYFMKGRILDQEKGAITYDIVELAENRFIIKAQDSGKTLLFKHTRYVYFPKVEQSTH